MVVEEAAKHYQDTINKSMQDFIVGLEEDVRKVKDHNEDREVVM
jgi:hypothetical protein